MARLNNQRGIWKHPQQINPLRPSCIAIQTLHRFEDQAGGFQHSIQATIHTVEAVHGPRAVHDETNAALGPGKEDFGPWFVTTFWVTNSNPLPPSFSLLSSSSDLLFDSVVPRFLKTKRSPATPSTKRVSSNSPSERFLSQILSNFLSLAWRRMDCSCATWGSTVLRTSLYIFHMLLRSGA